MAFDYSKLRGKIKEVFGSQKAFAAAMGKMDPATLSKKLNNAADWDKKEMVKACELLHIPLEETPLYFFCIKSCENTTE